MKKKTKGRHAREATELGRSIGLAIRRLREQREITQSQFAQDAQLSQGSISLIESGRADVSLAALQRIAQILGYNRLSRLIRLAEDVSDSEKILSEAKKFARMG